MTTQLSDLSLQGQRVLVRVDFNVPLDADGNVTSDARIRESLPTIRAILEAGGRPVLMAHLGRPKGKVVDSMRVLPAARRLAELLGSPVETVDNCVGDEVVAASRALADGSCLMLENLRFHAAEEQGDAEFARALAENGDVFVGDAFGAAHRAHASVSGVPQLLPSAAGLLMQRELTAFGKVLTDPERPFVAILGGAKVSDKLPVIKNLLPKVDALIIGGAMAYTFLRQQGLEVGKSLVEQDLLGAAGEVCAQAEESGKQLLLPVDHICAAEFAADSPASTHVGSIPDGLMGLDIGPQSVERFCAVIESARTVVWNGPMGVFEMDAFCRGTEAVAHAVAKACAAGAFTVVGGGDSVAAAEKTGVAGRLSHVSTGGGASLELLEGKQLPGVAALGSSNS
ncbi:MAG: phosphoglycerate kinase [Planctomycetota bacterium]|nr:phosphoglycerate kinase [Planctomycetota bacterium]